MTRNPKACRGEALRPAGTFLKLCFLLVFCGVMQCCKKDRPLPPVEEPPAGNAYQLKLPKGFPMPAIPADNPLTEKKIALGKRLFFDPILSRDNTISCGSCHEEDKYFTDNKALSVGIEGRTGTRNAPSLINIAYAPYLFWDGGNPTLEQQVIAPIDNHNELDDDVNKVVERLLRDTLYPALFQEAFGQAPNVATLTRAIASYERSLIRASSRYDDYLYNTNVNALTASEKRGLEIFMSEKGDCFHCHNGFNFTDNSFQNNGIYAVYKDPGRQTITSSPADNGKFKVPSLRNVAKTFPYMHDGSMSTLEDVVEHYNSGGKSNPVKSFLVQSLGLTEQDKKDLVNFLKSLTDQ